MLDYLRPIAIFAKTIELGSFRRAAIALDLSPSVVSHHISQLEAQLGVALIYRSTRSLSLTYEGTLLFEAACTSSAVATDALDAVFARKGKAVGQLRVMISELLAASPFVADIAAFSRGHPEIELDLIFSGAQQRDLISDGIDVAVRMGPHPATNSVLRVRRLAEVRWLLVASEPYAATKPVPVHPQDLSDWNWLKLDPLPNPMQFTNGAGEIFTPNFNALLTSDGIVALYHLMKEGLGIAAFPDFIVQADIASGKFVNVLPDWRTEDVPVFLISPRSSGRESLRAYFLEFLEGRAKSRRDANKVAEK